MLIMDEAWWVKGHAHKPALPTNFTSDWADKSDSTAAAASTPCQPIWPHYFKKLKASYLPGAWVGHLAEEVTEASTEPLLLWWS